jgi:hypothetical protein
VLAADFSVDGGGDLGIFEGEGEGHAIGHGNRVPGNRVQGTGYREQLTG